MSTDRYAIVANFQRGTSAVSEGAKAFVLPWARGDNESRPVMVRSRGGRWIQTWTRLHNLGNFRIKTVVEHGCPTDVWRDAFETREEAGRDLAWYVCARERMYTIDRDLGDEDRHP